MVSLSKRLNAVASLVESGSSVADVGTDHGYIPVYLVENKISPFVVAMDINEKPIILLRVRTDIYLSQANAQVG